MRLSRLFEGVGSYRYEVPEDKEQLLFDFYMYSFISGVKVDRPQRDDHMDYVIDEVGNKLTTHLKDELLDMLFFAIAAEARHADGRVFIDNNRIDWQNNETADGENVYGLVGDGLAQKWLSFARDLRRSHLLKDLPRDALARGEAFRGNASQRITAYQLALKHFTHRTEFVNLAKELFLQAWVDANRMEYNRNQIAFTDAYGGSAWAQVCDAWTRLNQATSRPELMVAIDHVYDVQHNNGTVLNKINQYAKQSYQRVSWAWILMALNF